VHFDCALPDHDLQVLPTEIGKIAVVNYYPAAALLDQDG
jgi:hypothetical protein